MSRLFLALFLCLPLVAQSTLDGIDSLIASAMKDWSVPGVAVAVVRDGAVVYGKGFGLRDVEKRLPVTLKTLFPIGSVTKPFTALAAGVLVDEGKIAWDRPVREYFPAFRLRDPFASERATMRDLLAHRTGIPNDDKLWLGSTLTRRQLVERLKDVDAAADFRSEYRYSSLMYIAAGYVAGGAAGMSWEDLVRSRIFEPLGMKRSNFSAAESRKSEDSSEPVDTREGAGPAGGIHSSAEEMAQFLLVQLGSGQRIVSEKTLTEMHRPLVVTGGGSPFAELLGTFAYGMGWGVLPYRGQKMIEHGSSSTSGFEALVSLLPDKKIGVVVLTNSGQHPVCTVIALNVYDRLLGLEQVPWNDRFKEMRKRMEAARAGRK